MFVKFYQVSPSLTGLSMFNWSLSCSRCLQWTFWWVQNIEFQHVSEYFRSQQLTSQLFLQRFYRLPLILSSHVLHVFAFVVFGAPSMTFHEIMGFSHEDPRNHHYYPIKSIWSSQNNDKPWLSYDNLMIIMIIPWSSHDSHHKPTIFSGRNGETPGHRGVSATPLFGGPWRGAVAEGCGAAHLPPGSAYGEFGNGITLW